MTGTYKGRVRFGCLACRASKVKCDEQHPVCKRCQRQTKHCLYTKIRAPRPPLVVGPVLRGLPADPLHQGRRYGPQLVETQSSTSTDERHSRNETAWDPLGSNGPAAAPERSPALLSTLIAENIYVCSTIDLLSARSHQASAAHFHAEVDVFFITPYDPVNWASFKDRLVELASHHSPVASATEALLVLYRARKNSLSHAKALAARDVAHRDFEEALCRQPTLRAFEPLFTAAFLLAMFEMLLPEDTSPSPFMRTDGTFVELLEALASSDDAQSALPVRLGAWALISHAAARRCGSRGLLSGPINRLMLRICDPNKLKPITTAPTHDSPPYSQAINACEPLFGFYFQLQLLSSQVAELSHYHRQRTTGADQEEVAEIMAVLQCRMDSLWQNRPMLMRLQPTQVRSQFPSAAISEPLILAARLCTLTYHTELVEVGRNLSAEQVPSLEAKAHLAKIRDMLHALDDSNSTGRAATLRPLFMYAIESLVEAEWIRAVDRMRKIKDPLCYSDFFANFAEGVCEMQHKRRRRVTTRWWCLQAFGVEPPYL